MTAVELAAIYNVPRSFFYELARAGRLPCVRLGRYVRFNRVDVEQAFRADQHRSKTAYKIVQAGTPRHSPEAR